MLPASYMGLLTGGNLACGAALPKIATQDEAMPTAPQETKPPAASHESDSAVRRAIRKTEPVKEPPTVGKPVIIDPPADPDAPNAPVVPDPEDTQRRT